jgi:hypothetical protein
VDADGEAEGAERGGEEELADPSSGPAPREQDQPRHCRGDGPRRAKLEPVGQDQADGVGQQ